MTKPSSYSVDERGKERTDQGRKLARKADLRAVYDGKKSKTLHGATKGKLAELKNGSIGFKSRVTRGNVAKKNPKFISKQASFGDMLDTLVKKKKLARSKADAMERKAGKKPAAKKSGAKKSGAKKSGAKKSAVKKSATSSRPSRTRTAPKRLGWF
jgi:hypothetical protein